MSSNTQTNTARDKAEDFINKIDTEDSDNADHVWSIDTSGKRPKIELEICKTKIKLTIDTAASINIIDAHTYKNLYLKPKLLKSSTIAYAYGS
jgi:hypothetical protein